MQKGCIREIIIDKCTQQGPTRYYPSDKRLSNIKYCVSEASNVRQTAHSFYIYLVVSTSDRGGYVDEEHCFKVEMGRGYMNTSPVFFFHGALGHVLKCTIVLTTSPIDVAFWWLFAYNFNKLNPKIPYGSSP